MGRFGRQFAQIKTGTYTGDGTTSQPITGVGFQPKFVWIVSVETSEVTEDTYAKFDGQSGEFALQVHAAGHLQNHIISLDSDGFTVDDAGTDAQPNKNGQSYTYLALR